MQPGKLGKATSISLSPFSSHGIFSSSATYGFICSACNYPLHLRDRKNIHLLAQIFLLLSLPLQPGCWEKKEKAYGWNTYQSMEWWSFRWLFSVLDLAAAKTVSPCLVVVILAIAGAGEELEERWGSPGHCAVNRWELFSAREVPKAEMPPQNPTTAPMWVWGGPWWGHTAHSLCPEVKT